VLFLDENKTQSQKAPEGASRCRVLTSGISRSRSAARSHAARRGLGAINRKAVGKSRRMRGMTARRAFQEPRDVARTV